MPPPISGFLWICPRSAGESRKRSTKPTAPINSILYHQSWESPRLWRMPPAVNLIRRLRYVRKLSLTIQPLAEHTVHWGVHIGQNTNTQRLFRNGRQEPS